MRILDLCSGLGGATEAFVQDGWEVLRIENNPMLQGVEHTWIGEIQEFEKWLIRNYHLIPEEAKPDVIWASPPCTEFSLANPNRPKNPSMELVECCLRIIGLLKPRYWILENVRGAIKFFEPIIGRPTQIIEKFNLWGNFPHIIVDRDFRHRMSEGDTWSTDPLRSNRRAYVPWEISRGLVQAIKNQKSITDY